MDIRVHSRKQSQTIRLKHHLGQFAWNSKRSKTKISHCAGIQFNLFTYWLVSTQ